MTPLAHARQQTMKDTQRPAFAADARLLSVAMWCLVIVAFANAMLHVLEVCRPLISSDYWMWVDPFLPDAVNGQLDLGNFLVKRAGVDHAQPLNRLVMLILYRYFDLDFMVEGILSMLFGLAALMALYRAIVADAPREGRDLTFHALFVAVAAVFFSLNTSMIYSYSIVTTWFSLYLFVFLQAWLAWRVLDGRAWWPFALVCFAYGIIGDDSALMLGAAFVPGVALYAWRTRQVRRPILVLALLGAALIACRLVYLQYGTIVGSTQAVFNQPLSARVLALAADWREAWRWIVIPAASGIADVFALQTMFGSLWQSVQLFVAALVCGAHVWFWWAALRLRVGSAWFSAVIVMLLFYAHVAALLFGRVAAKGVSYLEQPRYVSFYQLGIVALLVMAMAWRLEHGGAARRRWLVFVALALIAIQIPLSLQARLREPSLQAANRAMAATTAAVARDPRHPPAGCNLKVCTIPVESRVRMMALLQEHQLSLFSPRFQRRHPDLAEAAGLRATDSPAPLPAQRDR